MHEVDTNALTTLHEFEQKALELMLFVTSQKAQIKQAKKDIDELLKHIEAMKKESV